MASGTGLTTGPYNLAAASTITLDDPNARGGQVSERVQIQNQSGFTLTVFSSGAPYTIPALQATTIPTVAGGQSILVATSSSTSSVAGSVGGSVSAVWLLPDQISPISDGPLIVGAAIGSAVVGSKTHSFSIFFPGPYLDDWLIDYTVQRMTLAVTITGLTSGSILLQIQGNNSSQVYYLKTYTGSGSTTATFSVFGSVDSSIKVTTSHTGLDSPSISYTLTATESASTSNDVVPYGGIQSVYQTGIAPGVTATFLAAPGDGLAYRLHSWSVNKAITVAGDYIQLQSSTAGQIYDLATTYSTGSYLGGLIVPTDVQIHNQSSTITFGAQISYDLISLPLIS
jgi:hypothetical protein